jgi:hypothetical protein
MPRQPSLWRWSGLMALILFWPLPAFAIQTHGHPEGLYAHQLGHCAFLGAMLYVCWQLRQRRLLARPGFRRLLWACILFAVWNVLTFWGHWAEERLDPMAIDRQAGHIFRQLHITDLNGLMYYLASLDHLILIPAFFLFYLGLRAFLVDQNEMAKP